MGRVGESREMSVWRRSLSAWPKSPTRFPKRPSTRAMAKGAAKKAVSQLRAGTAKLRREAAGRPEGPCQQWVIDRLHAHGPRSVSFAGCAWLLTYHFGVGAEIQRRFDTSPMVFLGASSGAVTAAALACGVPCEEALRVTIEAAARVQHRKVGPAFKMTQVLTEALDGALPEDAHERVFRKAYFSVTELPRFKNRLLPERPLHDRGELLSLIRGSCYIPVYYERPVFHRFRPYLDGGVTDNLPTLDRGTVRVCPWGTGVNGVADIMPELAPPLRRVLFPELETLQALFDAGQRDARAYFDAHLGEHDAPAESYIQELGHVKPVDDMPDVERRVRLVR